MKKIIAIIAALALILTAILLCGCESEATKVNRNISKQADYFESLRKITVYNARTDNGRRNRAESKGNHGRIVQCVRHRLGGADGG